MPMAIHKRVCLLVEGRGLGVTSRGSRVNGRGLRVTSRGSRVNGRGSKNPSQLFTRLAVVFFFGRIDITKKRCIPNEQRRNKSKDAL